MKQRICRPSSCSGIAEICSVLRQRLTVTVTDALLMGAAAYTPGPASSSLSRRRSHLAFALVVGHAGLLLVDQIHFQYNGMLLG